MRLLIQRVHNASVNVEGDFHSKIGNGLLVLLGITYEDTVDDVEWLVGKLAKLRIFDDEDGVMNLDIDQVDGELLLVSQFTLFASTKKGSRPSYIRAAGEIVALPLYDEFIRRAGNALQKPIKTGVFGAKMEITSTNNGPVSIWIDSKNRE